MGTHHGGHDSCKLLAVVPNSACGIAVGKATKLVGFVHQLPGKSLCEQPSGKAVVANNIAVPPVGKDALSLSNTQFTPLCPSAWRVINPNTGAEVLEVVSKSGRTISAVWLLNTVLEDL